MTDRPIIFSDLMIRALLDGRKTQTRRVLKSQPPAECSIHFMLGNESWLQPTEKTPLRHVWEAWVGPLYDNRPTGYMAGLHEAIMPYAPGDRLWVRETWRPRGGYSNWDLLISYPADGGEIHLGDGDADIDDWNFPKAAKTGNVSPALMPRWASRLTLTVTDVRVQRLQDISDEDAEAEGVEGWNVPTWGDDYEDWWRNYQQPDQPFEGSPLDSFRTLWNSINGPDAWDANPWVVALTFDVHQQNIDHMRDAA